MMSSAPTTIATTPFSLTYLPYVNLGEAILSAVCLATTIALMGNLLYRARFDRAALRSSTVPPMMYVYLATHVIFSVLVMPYMIYTIAWWRLPDASTPDNATTTAAKGYDPHVVYWLALNFPMYVCLAPVPLTFLTLDRCLVMTISVRIHRLRRHLAILSVISLLIFYFILLGVYLLELPLQLDHVTGCVGSPCMVSKTLWMPWLMGKVFFETVSLSFCIYFFYLLRKKKEAGSSAAGKVKNQVVATLAIIELLLGVFPSYTSTIFTLITHESIVNYTGRYASTFSTLDAFCCSVFYSLIMLRRSGDRISPNRSSGTVTEVAAVVKRKSGLASINSSSSHVPRFALYPVSMDTEPTEARTIQRRNTSSRN